MTTPERPYENSIREELIKILDNTPPESVKLAMIYVRVEASRIESSKRLWEKEFKKIIKERKVFKGLPKHKAEWYLDAVDLVARSLKLAPEGELNIREIEGVVELSGLFEKRQVDKRAEKRYRNPRNWKIESGYEDDLRGVYIGDRDLQRLVIDHSRFGRDNLRTVLTIMESEGYIIPGEGRFNLRLSGKE